MDSRRGRKPLDISNIVYWFKNARAAHKRQECTTRYFNGASSPILDDTSTSNDGQNVYNNYMENLQQHYQEAYNLSRSPTVKTEPEDMTINRIKTEQSEPKHTQEEPMNIDMEQRLRYPMMPSAMLNPNLLSQSLYMSQYMSAGFNPISTAITMEERRKRNRTFIDPVTEVPRLEHWFQINTHPTHALILKYTEELNRLPYRHKFPKLEPKNVQFWFKNRRAKCKRLKLSL